jgi:hypothetical protein
MQIVRIIRFLVMVGFCLATWFWNCGEVRSESSATVAVEQEELLHVTVHRLIIDPTSQQPVVILADSFEERALLIWIDFFEANAMHWAMQGVKHRRPQTHDLLERIIEKLNGTIRRIVIPRIEENIYYATILVETGDSLVEIDARPSDSIVLALKFNAPIYVSKTLFKEMAVPLGEPKGIEEVYGLTLQDLNPSLAKAFSFGSTRGVLVSDVRPGSSAEKDGLRRGDIFVEVGSQAVENVMLLRDALAKSKAGVQARLFRKAQYLTVTLHLQ